MVLVGSWPGQISSNAFVHRFCQSLKSAGATLEPVEWPHDPLCQKLDVLHVHWLEKAFWGAGNIIAVRRALGVLVNVLRLRLAGVKIVWCVHNLEPLKGGTVLIWFWRLYSAAFSFLVNGFVTLSPSTIAIARATFPGLRNKPSIFAWHPHYEIDLSSLSKTDWRQRNDVPKDSRVIALIGQLRPYKGVEDAVSALSQTDDKNLRLLLAGSPETEAYADYIRSAARLDPRIVLNLGYLSEDELASAVVGSDAVVLPYRKTLHSGSLIYALSCGRPVITPDNPYARDLKNQTSQGWVTLYKGKLTGQLLSDFRPIVGHAPDLKFLSIEESGSKLLRFYRSL